MARKGQFKKGGGRVGGSTRKSSSRKRRSHHSTAMVHAPRTHTVYKTRTRHVKVHSKRRRAVESSAKLGTLALVGAGAAYLMSDKSGEMTKSVREAAAKIPGAATFGPVAALGLGAFAVNRFVLKRKNKYLSALATIGVVAAAMKIGEQGTDFKFVGDVGDVGDYNDDDED
jgi:hypothetical protein